MHTLGSTINIAIFAAATLLIGCSISKNDHGDRKDVKIATPFGGLQIRTNDADVLGSIGLPAYPGATAVKKEKEDGKENDGSADVNLSFGSFQLKVKAASFRTGDSPDKVLAFYKKGLGRFGNVIQCEGKHPVGTPIRTTEGLTCDTRMDNAQIHGSFSDDDAKMQLKAGSKKHQHIVDINPEGAGTKFGLIALDLPTDFHFGKDSDDKNDEQ